ncbi:MAG: SIMPL domain-containing protein [Candidatus Paceibacterota bacterium]
MNPTEQFWKVASLVGLVLVLFLVVVSIKEVKSIGYVGKSEQIVNSISVNGKGEVMATPDIATFSFSVTETAKTVTEAQTAATAKSAAALKAVRDAGIKDKDIQTISYTINPHYEYQEGVCPAVMSPYSSVSPCRPGKSVLTGYDVSQTILVKIRELDKAGTIFSSIGALGVQNVNGLDFSVDKPEAVKAQARALAITDAKTKANELAKQLGVKIIRITSYYENGDQAYPMYGRGGSDMKLEVASMAAPAPELPAGEQKMTSNVTITYEIK